MKKLLILMVAVMMSSLTFAQRVQEQDVPVIVRTTIKEKFPQTNAQNTTWEKDKEHYRAVYRDRDNDQYVKIRSNGRIMEIKEKVNEDVLPANMRNYVENNYSGHRIKEVHKTTDENGNVTYHTEVKGKNLIFDRNGNYLREEKK